MDKVDLHIEGMHCGSCALGIQMLVSQIDGVSQTTVDYEGKKGTVEFDSAKTNKEAIVKEISVLGYQAS